MTATAPPSYRRGARQLWGAIATRCFDMLAAAQTDLDAWAHEKRTLGGNGSGRSSPDLSWVTSIGSFGRWRR
jgi:hypothetical protein